MGVERIYILITKKIDKTSPYGKNWHINLFNKMLVEIPSVRSAVISQITYEKVNELRGFRNVVRSLYAYNLKTQRVINLANQINQYYEIFKTDIQIFFNELWLSTLL